MLDEISIDKYGKMKTTKRKGLCKYDVKFQFQF
jgi:hypothetical protein